MSEKFDPDKIYRMMWTKDGMDCEVDPRSDGLFTYASDYDKLLEMYRELRNLEPVWRHLIKRAYDECGTDKTEDFIQRVKDGEHD